MFHYFGSNNSFSGMKVEKVSMHLCRTTQKRTIPSMTKILCNAIRKRVDVMRSQSVMRWNIDCCQAELGGATQSPLPLRHTKSHRFRGRTHAL